MTADQAAPRSVVVVGGGIIGVATARRVLQLLPGVEVTLLEKESALALHQTGRNSGVVHAGVYYPPGSLKARLCRAGVPLLQQFCAEQGLTWSQLGKVVVGLEPSDLPQLRELAERAQANGVPGARLIDRAELAELEPHVCGIGAVHSPTTAIVDYSAVTMALAQDARSCGAHIRTGVEVTGFARTDVGQEVVATSGGDVRADLVIVCAGVHADTLAHAAGDTASPVIVPFRGAYRRLAPRARYLVRGLVYPLPDPRYPFLGIHLTPRMDGEVLVGPNAVLAAGREAYALRDANPRELFSTLGSPGFRTLATQHWRTGVREALWSWSGRAFLQAARAYLPELTRADLQPAPSGIRAQAMDADGSLVDDFRIVRRGNVVLVRNAPSPAATSSLAIAQHIVDLALER